MKKNYNENIMLAYLIEILQYKKNTKEKEYLLTYVYILYIIDIYKERSTMEIIISNSSGVPIYEQIKEQIKMKIIANELKENELLPSIRALARDLRCSVITTKNAYEELVKEGYVKTIPAKGFYVAKVNIDIALEEQMNKIEELLEKAINLAKINNVSRKTINEMLDILYKECK